MALTIEVFQSTTGKNIKKVEANDGRVMRFADGKPISSSSYAAYKSHTVTSERFQRDNLQEIQNTDQLGSPFDSRTMIERGNLGEPGTDEYIQNVRNNQWVGFYASEDTPDDPFKAAEEYEKMVSELTDVKSEQRRQEIKESYNIGGS